MIVGSGFAEEFHMRWFWQANPPANVFVRSQASTLCGVSIAGPKSRELIQLVTRDDISSAAFRLFQVMETSVGFAPPPLTRLAERWIRRFRSVRSATRSSNGHEAYGSILALRHPVLEQRGDVWASRGVGRLRNALF